MVGLRAPLGLRSGLGMRRVIALSVDVNSLKYSVLLAASAKELTIILAIQALRLVPGYCV